MIFFIISDIHGCFTAFEKAIKHFNQEKADMMIICGDYLNHGPRNAVPEGYAPKETALLLNEYKEKIISVRGNCDSEVDQMLLSFPVQGSYAELFVDLKISKQNKLQRIFVHHGHLYKEEELLKLTAENTFIISGHTHEAILEAKNSRYFLNPGSISIPRNGAEPTYAVFNTSTSQIELKGLNTGNIFKKLQLE